MPQPKKHASSADRQKAYRKRCARARQAEMNGKGLPPLPVIANMPGWPRWNASINAAHELVDRTVEEMQEYFGERTQAWQEGERGGKHQERLDAAQTALDALADFNL